MENHDCYFIAFVILLILFMFGFVYFKNLKHNKYKQELHKENILYCEDNLCYSKDKTFYCNKKCTEVY